MTVNEVADRRDSEQKGAEVRTDRMDTKKRDLYHLNSQGRVDKGCSSGKLIYYHCNFLMYLFIF